MSIFLGIDIGTSGTKTLAIDEKGQIRASAMETYPCYAPKPLWSEQDPEDWWRGDRRFGPQSHGESETQIGRREIDRPLRADARLGVSRQVR